MELKKKNLILSTFFLIKYLNPFFYELIIDSVKTSKAGSLINKKKPLNLRMSNKTLVLLIIYLNIFSTKNLKEGINLQSTNTNANLLYSRTKNKLIREIEVQFNSLTPILNKSLFSDFYLSKDNENSALGILKSIQIIKNLNNV